MATAVQFCSGQQENLRHCNSTQMQSSFQFAVFVPVNALARSRCRQIRSRPAPEDVAENPPTQFQTEKAVAARESRSDKRPGITSAKVSANAL